MSLEFTVCGPYVRVLLNTLACVSRIGDVVFVEGVEDGIEVSAVSPTGNSHIAVRVHRHCFARLNVSHAPQHGGTDAAALHAASADVHEPPVASPPVHLCVLTKTLAATVLRQHNSSNVQTLELRYRTESRAAAEAEDGDDADGAGDGDRELWQGREEADLVRLHCTYARGVNKTFLLRLTDGEPRSVAVDASLYHFEVCGAARTYGQLLGSLPTSANRCSLTLLEGGGLELRSAQQPSYPGMDSAARSGGGGGGNHSAAASGGAGAADSSSETKVTAFPKTFSLFRYFEAVTAGESAEAESGASEVPPTPSPTPHASSPTAPQHSGGNFTVPTVTTGFIALPQKSFDVKPVKNAAWLAEQLGTQLHVLLGAEGVPLRLGSITEEEVEHRRGGAAAAPSDANQRTTGSTLRQGSLLAGGAGRRPGYAGGGRVSAPSSASFTVYVAAEDMVVDAARGGAGGVGRGSVGGAADTSLATAISSAATSPRHSTHARASRGVGGGVAGGVGDVGGGIAGATAAAGAAPAPPSATSVLVGATHSSMNASLSTAEGEHGRVSGTPDKTGAWQEDCPDLQWRRDRMAQALDPHSLSPSHVADSFTSQQGSSSNSNGAEEGTGAGPGRGHPRQPRESASTVDSAYATPRPSASPLGSTLVVMTGNETPAMPPMPGARAGGAEYIVGALHNVAATPPVLVSPPAGSRVSMVGATQEASAATALNSMYPLDFEAFVRTYTSAQEEGDGEGEDGAEDPQDAELREFLASCVASLSREPTQS